MNFFVIYWGGFYKVVSATNSRLFIGWFGLFMYPLLHVAFIVYNIGFLLALLVDIDGIREPIFGSLLYGNNIVFYY